MERTTDVVYAGQEGRVTNRVFYDDQQFWKKEREERTALSLHIRSKRLEDQPEALEINFKKKRHGQHAITAFTR